MNDRAQWASVTMDRSWMQGCDGSPFLVNVKHEDVIGCASGIQGAAIC